jgi:hypothetical protein
MYRWCALSSLCLSLTLMGARNVLTGEWVDGWKETRFPLAHTDAVLSVWDG